MGSLIYIVAVILFAVISGLNKTKKQGGPGKPSGGGMPTFGGGGGERGGPVLNRPNRPQGTAGRGSGFPVPKAERSGTSSWEEPSRSARPSEPPERSSREQFPSPDYETGEGVSLEQAEDSVELRTRRMEEELRRVHASFDGIAKYGDSLSESPQEKRNTRNRKPEPSTSSSSSLTTDQEQLRNGLIWAEILGPPRSRRPHSLRKD